MYYTRQEPVAAQTGARDVLHIRAACHNFIQPLPHHHHHLHHSRSCHHPDKSQWRLCHITMARSLNNVLTDCTILLTILLTRASGPYFSRRRLAKPSINLNSSDVPHLHTGPCKFLILSYDFCLYLLVGRETASDSPHQLQTQSRSVNPTQISTHSTQ